MKLKIILTLLIILGGLVPCCEAGRLSIINSSDVLNESLNSEKSNSFNFTDPVTTSLSGDSSKEEKNKGTQAGSDMITEAFTEDIPRSLGDSVFDQFGGVRKWITMFYTWNIKPWLIPGVEKFYNNNLLLVFPLIFLFVMGATLAKFFAIANPQAVKDVFGETTWAYKDSLGGTLFMLIGAFSGGAYYAFMLLLDIINLYLMFQVMETIEPSIDNAFMYFFMALVTIGLFIFFVYRQMWIVAGYALSPIYGVLFASGCFSSFTDSIGEMWLRAMIMQPFSIMITVFWLIVIKGVSLEMFGVTVWEGSDATLAYLALFVVLLAGCCWCVWGNFSLMNRAKKLVMVGKMVI